MAVLHRNLLLISAGLLLGVFVFLLKRDYLVITWLGRQRSTELDMLTRGGAVSAQKVLYFFYKDGKLASEPGTLVWDPENTTKSIERLIGDWLLCVQDAKLVARTVTLRSAALSFGDQEIFLNLSQSLLPKHVSVMYKLHIIEGLLKTLYTVCQGAGVSLQGVRFFVGDEAMPDAHLDFSHAWPITGYLN